MPRASDGHAQRSHGVVGQAVCEVGQVPGLKPEKFHGPPWGERPPRPYFGAAPVTFTSPAMRRRGSRHAGKPRPHQRAGQTEARGRAEEGVQQGASIRTLAHGCGRSYGFVHRILTEAGTAMRTRGGSNARRRTSAREGEGIAGYNGRPSGGSP
ncbi:helix-turn-helix domain-containing protein [Streptomyces sp. NPDC102476]|uniref:helix-turn-helix domain-containing protein n=1 Tax=Streptomyces sp. NPDC102476 TaxID=3366181 RepID=UPI0038066C94